MFCLRQRVKDGCTSCTCTQQKNCKIWSNYTSCKTECGSASQTLAQRWSKVSGVLPGLSSMLVEDGCGSHGIERELVGHKSRSRTQVPSARQNPDNWRQTVCVWRWHTLAAHGPSPQWRGDSPSPPAVHNVKSHRRSHHHPPVDEKNRTLLSVRVRSL